MIHDPQNQSFQENSKITFVNSSISHKIQILKIGDAQTNSKRDDDETRKHTTFFEIL